MDHTDSPKSRDSFNLPRKSEKRKGRDLCSQGIYRYNLALIKRAEKIKSRAVAEDVWQANNQTTAIWFLSSTVSTCSSCTSTPWKLVEAVTRQAPCYTKWAPFNSKILVTVSFRQGWMEGGRNILQSPLSTVHLALSFARFLRVTYF